MTAHERHHEVAVTALAGLAAGLLALLPSPSAGAPCPKVVIQVDHDIPGSGYSEVNAKNWTSLPYGSCHKNYRYQSHTVGDGSRKGKAIWKPKIKKAGWYSVMTSYRATTNRTSDADYYLHGDTGSTKKVVVSQKHSGDCTKKTLGTIYCKVGGSCRLVLDGTDDSQSDSADITTFTLVNCGGTAPDAGPAPDTSLPKGPCAKIAANSGYELCKQSTTTCAGVFKNSAGCKAFCAAAGMICTARYGGEPGCAKEPQNKLSCSASNGHTSDWCECALALKPDLGPPPDLFQPPPDAKQAADSKRPPDALISPDAGPPMGHDAGPATLDSAPAAADQQQQQTADGEAAPGSGTLTAGCAMGGAQQPTDSGLWMLLAGAALVLLRRRRW